MRFTANTLGYNPNQPYFQLDEMLYKSVSYVVDQVNNSNEILTYFKLEYDEMGCGNNRVDADFIQNCLELVDNDLGLYHIASYNIYVVMEIMKQMGAKGIQPLIVQGFTTSTLLDGLENKLYFRSCPLQNSQYYGLFYVMSRYYNWKQILMQYPTDPFVLEVIDVLKEISETIGPKIENKEVAGVNSYTDTQGLLSQTDNLDSIKNGKTRIFLPMFWATNTKIVFDALKQYGALDRQLLLVVPYDLTLSAVSYTDEDLFIRKAYNGGISSYYLVYLSAASKEFEENFIQRYGFQPNSVTCGIFDGTMLMAQTLDYSLLRGIDYEDPLTLRQAAQNIKFHGCQGFIKLKKEGNFIEEQTSGIFNLRVDDEGNLSKILVQIYNPFSSARVESTQNEIVWPDNSTGRLGYPDIEVFDYDCAVPDEGIVTGALFLTVFVHLGVIIVPGVLAVYLLINIDKTPLPIIKSDRQVCWQDIMLLIAVLCDFVQLLNVDLNLKYIHEPFEYWIKLGAVDLSVWIVLKSSWKLLCTNLYVAIIIYSIVSVIALKYRESESQLIRLIKRFGEILLPLGSNLLFLPVMKAFLFPITCYHGFGDNISDTYMEDICDVRCWEDQHIFYGIFNIIAAFTFAFVTCFVVTHWTSLEYYLQNIKYNPIFALPRFELKLLSVFATGLSHFSNQAADIILMVAVLMQIASCFKYKMYNYSRIEYFHLGILVATFYCLLIQFISLQLEDSSLNFTFQIIASVGLAIIILATLLIMLKYTRNLIRNSKKLPIELLIKFEFGQVHVSEVVSVRKAIEESERNLFTKQAHEN